jgi:hypothetical protein
MRLGMFVAGLVLLVIGGFAGIAGYAYLTQHGMTIDQIVSNLPPDFTTIPGLMTAATAGGVIFALVGLGLVIGGAASKIVIKSADPLVLRSMTEKEPVLSPTGIPENVTFCQDCGRPISLRDDYCAVCGAKVR